MKYLLSCLLFGWTASIQAAEPSLSLPIGSQTYTLNKFHDQMSERCFGAYYGPDDHTVLDLYPNGRFDIVFADHVIPDELQALGRYRVAGDRLTLQFTKVRPTNRVLPRKFAGLHLLWGWVVKKEGVSGFEAFVFPAQDWQMLHRAPGQANYFQRRESYEDWAATLRRYDARRGLVRWHGR